MLRVIASILVGVSVSVGAAAAPGYVFTNETNLTRAAGLPRPHGAVVFNQAHDAFVYAAVEEKFKPVCVFRYVELDASVKSRWTVKRSVALSHSLRCGSKLGFVPGEKYAYFLNIRPNSLKVFSLGATPAQVTNDLNVGEAVYWTADGGTAFTTLPSHPYSFWSFDAINKKWFGRTEMISNDFAKWAGSSTLKDWFVKSGMVELVNNDRLNEFIGNTSLEDFLGKNPVKNLEPVQKLRRMFGNKKLKDIVTQAEFKAWADENGLTQFVNSPIQEFFPRNGFNIVDMGILPSSGSKVLVTGKSDTQVSRYQVRIWNASTRQWIETKIDWRSHRYLRPESSVQWTADGRFILVRHDEYKGGWDWKSRVVRFELWDARGQTHYRTEFAPVSFPRNGWSAKWDKGSDRLDFIESTARPDLALLAHYTKPLAKKSAAKLTLDLLSFPVGTTKASVTATVPMQSQRPEVSGTIFKNGRVLTHFEDQWLAWDPTTATPQHIREPGPVAAVVSDGDGSQFETVLWDPAKGFVVHTWELK